DEYQRSVLRRIEGPRRWHGATLTEFSVHRLRGAPLRHENLGIFAEYEAHLEARRILDFDMLLLRAAALLEDSDASGEVRGRWDVVLVDEFQDLNPVQYGIMHALARDHRHVF